ncbi:MAG TPA: aminotransferase class V-fold PLP-dependent enzyme [Bacteroidales bacterium]|nr:aminotransferase class V-fold PLP-dependent enzyme [Bacteroidales bacterium]
MSDSIEQSIFNALCYYSNVHRGNGYNSRITTELFEEARNVVLDFAGKKRESYGVLFCSPLLLNCIEQNIPEGSFTCISGESGLNLGVSALILKKDKIRHLKTVLSGGGTARLISPDWVVWARGSEKLEAGTPPVINILIFVISLLQQRQRKKIKQTESDSTAYEILYNDGLNGISGKELYDKLSGLKVGNGITVPTVEGEKPFINLDYAASTPTFMPVWNAWKMALMQKESVQHDLVNETRIICGDFCNAPSDEFEIFFTANTTESLNIAARNIPFPASAGQAVVLTTMLEHTSNDLPWRLSGAKVIRTGINKEGLINLQEMEDLLKSYNRDTNFPGERINIVSISGASNVLGIFNPIEAISEIVHRYGAVLVVDAAQMAAHSAISMKGRGIDCISFSAHKVYAPFGTGVLIARKGLINENKEIEDLRSSEIKNAAGIAALGKALVLLKRIGMDQILKEEQDLTARLLEEMAEIRRVTVYGIKDNASPAFSLKGSVIPFTVDGLMADQVAKELAAAGIGIRSGCHCAHILVKHILGVGPNLARFQRVIVTLFPKLKLPGVARISFGIGTTRQEVEVFLNALRRLASEPRNLQYKKFSVPMKTFVSKVTEDILSTASSL